MYIIRRFTAKGNGHCCDEDGQGKIVKTFPHPLPYDQSENSKDFPGLLKISMKDWISNVYSVVLNRVEDIFDRDCPGGGSTRSCDVSLRDVHTSEEAFQIPFGEFEEMIYEAYSKKYRTRLIPTKVTDATAYLKEYGMPHSKKVPAHGIDIERYCIGDHWCFDTIKHADTFRRRYSKVSSIM